MRKLILLGVVPLILCLGIPAVAEAHHLEQDTSTLACVLVNNAPTLQVHAQYRDFNAADLPVSVTTTVDHQPITGGSYSITTQTVPSLPDFADNKSYPLAPGVHDVLYDASWNHDRYGGHFGATVVCPAPVPPPPPPTLCNGVPMTPGANCAPPPPPVYCNGKLMPPGTPPSCKTPPATPPPCATKCTPPPHRCVPGHYRITVTPKHLLHGKVVFRLIGPRTSHIRWYVNGKRVHGGRPYSYFTHGGRRLNVYLWVESIWGYPQWGRRTVVAKFHGRCGPGRAHVPYFNNDPQPRAHAWEATAHATSYGTG
jgi:hypothetical protein